MLTRNNSNGKIHVKQEKVKTITKRRYSQITETNHTSEPLLKLRKLKTSKCENDENSVENVIDEVLDKTGSEFKDFIKHFAIPSNIYKYLSIRHKSNPTILKRCLSYNKDVLQAELSRPNIQSIADHLSTVRFHDENLSLMKGKQTNSTKLSSPMKIALKFGCFFDNRNQKDWETVEANVYVDIVHFHRDNRKNKEGFCSSRIVSGQRIMCNKSGADDSGERHTIDLGAIMAALTSYRVHKSLIHFKILAKERKMYIKNISEDKRSEEVYPVTYEAMMPLFSSRDEHHGHKEAFFVQAGKYEIFPRVTNMEQCDDSVFCGVIKNEYNPEGDKHDNLDFQWVKIDDIQSIGANRNSAKFIFTIANEESSKSGSKPLKNNNKSLPPIIKLSPTTNGDLCLASTRNEIKSQLEINIAFKFVVEGKVVQWTKTSHLMCPWCQLHFIIVSDMFATLTKMMTHLNYMHPKFIFICKKLTNSATFKKNLSKKFVTIDVSLAPVSVSEWDLGLMLKHETLPAQRMPLTEVIYSKHKASIPNLYRAHHKRDYCHTWSSRKNKYIEFDIDSEAEENLGWLYDHYSRKVEEFSDLNHIEKKVIQMWNESLLKYGVSIGDLQMRGFIEHFVADIIENKEKLRQAMSFRNTLLLHLVNLIDYGLLPASTMLRCMRQLDVAMGGLP